MQITKGSCYDLTSIETEYLFGLIVRQELPGWERLDWDGEFSEWLLRKQRAINLHRNGLIIYQCQQFFKLSQIFQAGEFWVDHSKPASMPWAYESSLEDPNCRMNSEHLCTAVALCLIRSRFGIILSRQPHGYPEIDFINKDKKPAGRRARKTTAPPTPPVRRRRRRSV